jgi:thiamine kinase-like enzyme
LTQVGDLTPEWLTEVLTQAGALHSGSVTHIAAQGIDTNTATASVLNITYSADAEGDLPGKLFFKIGKRSPEVLFYRHIADRLIDVPLVRCYCAQFANELGQSNLLFDDISATHGDANVPPDVPDATLRRMVTMMAALHCQWWEHPDLKAGGALAPLVDDVTGFISGQARERLPAFMQAVGDTLTEPQRGWITQAVSAWPLPKWQARIDAHHAVTLVHGDFHYWNLAYPHDETGPLYLMDWAVWHINLPAFDLAYLIAINSPISEARRMEQDLLPFYLNQLGMAGYDMTQLWEDYRIAVIFYTIMLVFWQAMMPDEIWARVLSQVMTSFDALDCVDLL